MIGYSNNRIIGKTDDIIREIVYRNGIGHLFLGW